MSHPRTARSRWTVAVGVVALALTLVACDDQAAVDEIADELIAESQEDDAADGADDGAADEDDAEMDEGTDDGAAEEEVAATSGAVTAIDYRTCHEKQRAGGNSDGVFVLTTDLPSGTMVEVDILVQDGAMTVPLTGEVDEDGRVTVVAPLTNIGERVSVLGARGPDGTALDIDVMTGDESFVVSDASDCSTHPDAEDEE